jgi:hypothetical protein
MVPIGIVMRRIKKGLFKKEVPDTAPKEKQKN